MTDTTTGPAQAPSLVKVLAALAELGEATAAAVAEHAGLGYSTTTPKLRQLESSGQAEPFRAADRRTLWRLTEAGHAAVQAGLAIVDDDALAESEVGNADSITDNHVTLTRVDRASDERAEHVDEGSDEQSEPADEETTGAPIADTDDDNTTEEVASTSAEEEATSSAVSDTDGVESVEPDTSPAPAGGGDATSEPQTSDDPAASGSVDPNDAEPPADETRPDGSDTGQLGSEASADADSTPQATRTPPRRGKGALRGAVVDILENHPDRQYKVGELCKLINQGQQESGMPKASAGAVANVLDKLAGAGIAVQTVAKPATFQLAPRED